jgi:hypothetical protein
MFSQKKEKKRKEKKKTENERKKGMNISSLLWHILELNGMPAAKVLASSFFELFFFFFLLIVRFKLNNSTWEQLGSSAQQH